MTIYLIRSPPFSINQIWLLHNEIKEGKEDIPDQKLSIFTN